GREDEISTVRDSVLNEPVFTGQLKQAELGQWLAQKRSQCTRLGNWAVTLAAALTGGSFAVLGAVISGGQGLTHALYMTVFAPIIEELLKQSGMIYLLEKKPYRIFSAGQFLIAAAVSAFIFSASENLLYIWLYIPISSLNNPHQYSLYRWTVCTLLHLVCSLIASLGLIRVWKIQLKDSRAADLSHGFVFFAAAMALHGLYNLAAGLFHPHF
ncbi:MAG TPA: PrsW family glutamic-type intramembrane protease, partial [Anaerohalosphaeraceae bacterium]|nr:PrsW family glutamic-type intramembrane protease [Anaerohalosphaeraceae bacterium]